MFRFTMLNVLVTAAAMAGPHIKVFDGSTGATLHSFLSYDPQFLGGVYVGSGDVDGDAFDDIITGSGSGAGPHVKVFSGRDPSSQTGFFAFDPAFTGDVRVAAGDVNGDGRPDIITGAGTGAGGHVRVFDGKTLAELDSFFAFGTGFLGGVYVAGSSAIVSAGDGMRATVLIYDAPGGAFVATSTDVPEPGTWFLCSGFFGLLWIAAVARPRKR